MAMRNFHRYNKEYVPKCACNIAAESAAAIIGAAGAIGGAATSAAGQASLNKKTREFNREEAEKQRAWNESMAEKQNAWNYDLWLKSLEYDKPENQVQRLRDAGLNPLFYGLDGNAAPAAPEAAQPLGYERASLQNQPNPFASFQDAALKVAQIANIQADTAKKGEETQEVIARREKILAEIENTKQQYNNLLAQEGLTKAQRTEIEKNLEWLDRLNEATLNEKTANAELNRAQKKRIEELLEGEKILQSKNIEDFEFKWQKIKAECAKMAKETGLLQKDIENYALNHASNGVFGSGLSIQNIIRALRGDKDETPEEKETRQRTADAAGIIYDAK